MGKLTLSIGDIHGENRWKLLGDIEQLILNGGTPKYDLYIFVGDYVDAFYKQDKEIIDNLQEIIDFKKKYPSNVILLLGNHDIQYLFIKNTLFMCTGYRPWMYDSLHKLFNNNITLFKVAFGIGSTIWTHAGVHGEWYRKTGLPCYKGDAVKLADKINYMYNNDVSDLYDVGYMRGGMNNVGGPLWLDKSKLYKHPLKRYNQIVGHTETDSILTFTVNGIVLSFIDSIQKWNSNSPIMSEKLARGLVRYVE